MPIDDKMIEHADRAWMAECENAERIVKERHLVLTLLVAFLGVGLFKVDWLQAMVNRGEYRVAAWVIASLLTIAAWIFVIAIFALAHRPSRISASVNLSLPKKAYFPADAMTVDEQKRTCFARTYRAYQELQSRNEKARDQVTRAWTFFGVGIAVVAVAILVYIQGQLWAVMH